MNLKFISSKSLTFACAIFSIISISSCDFETVSDHFSTTDGLNVSVTEPVEFDFTDIKNRGTLRMITRYSSNTYFLHQGVEWGFEYELVNQFADEHDLGLEVIIVGPEENPYDLLNSGKGDIIAANYTITPERDKYVKFSRAYNVVDQLVVFSNEVENPPQTIEELAGSDISLTVRRNSSYYHRIQELREQGYEISVNIVSDDKDTESLLFDISSGNYEATVADDNIFQASNKYMAGLAKGPTIAEKDTIAWAIRENAPELETQLNRFLYKHFRFSGPGEPPKRSTFLNVLRERYFEEGPQIAEYYNPEKKVARSGIISPYDDMIKSIADSAGIDWLMIASMVAQETKFNPNSKSWAGAIGLMQVMPRFSEVEDKQLLYDEETNLREGVRIISEHLNHYAYMDSTDQWAFALATYNAGQGHLADARRLVVDQNKNPNEWEPTADALLKLMQRKYYKDARYGFCRGIETVRYVQEILNRYKTYESILAITEQNKDPNRIGVLGVVN
ncbi:MAG: transporter substrate-binding domain-containing protein [Balneolaceae bacterium]|nr:transporter substrate-binding domain-containing protein [Balneolaceae bacterium]